MNLPLYDIPGCTNLSQDPAFRDPTAYPQFQEDLTRFKELLEFMVDHKQARSYIKMGDGDYYFLKQEPVGSAKPGYRALSKPYADLNMMPFRSGFVRNDYVSVEISPGLRSMWKELYPDRHIDYPGEYAYGLLHSRWLTETFSGRVGLIGADRKIDIIENLMKHKAYQQYLGLEKFTDYIRIPQKFACDDLEAVKASVESQLAKSSSGIFLYGVGHIKGGLIHSLKDIHPAVYLDIGGAMDGLAGIIDYERPYAGGWINHRLRDYDYGGVDFMYFKPQDRDVWL